MVWFQCEDCGENLKKPKLPNHFRICYASKLSCIDCGEVFGQESVQSHTQCITEAEKYGPKGQGKAPNATSNKPNNNGKPKPDVDINVGLSDRPPWFCSLCNTQATSEQTLLLHADGKKHRAKARAFHAANQKPMQAEDSAQGAKFSNEKDKKDDDIRNVKEPKEQQPTKIAPNFRSSDTENGSLKSSNKRKIETSNYDVSMQTTGGGPSGELGNGEVIQVATEGTNSHSKKAKRSVTKEEKVAPSKDGGKKKIKWKKLITSVLKEAPEGSLKMRKLKKLVMKNLSESGCADDEGQLSNMLEHKINSSSKFSVDGKYVRLVPKC